MNWTDDDGQPINRRFNRIRRGERATHELLGFIKGILADHEVHPKEVVALGRWLVANAEDAPEWPMNVITERVAIALEDDVVTPEECQELEGLFRELTGKASSIPVGRNPATQLPLTRPEPVIEFPDRQFVFTGKFMFGTRSTCEEEVHRRGGRCGSNVTQDTNFLVIGEIGSADWLYSTHGRKIEAAVQNASKGLPIVIVAEEHWCKFIL